MTHPASDTIKDITYQITNNIHGCDQATTEYGGACKFVWSHFPSGYKEVLRRLVTKGPVWDGDIASKTYRDDLLLWGLASRACVKGEQGYTVANYHGFDVWKSGQKT